MTLGMMLPGKVLKMDDCAIGGDAFSYQVALCPTLSCHAPTVSCYAIVLRLFFVNAAVLPSYGFCMLLGYYPTLVV